MDDGQSLYIPTPEYSFVIPCSIKYNTFMCMLAAKVMRMAQILAKLLRAVTGHCPEANQDVPHHHYTVYHCVTDDIVHPDWVLNEWLKPSAPPSTAFLPIEPEVEKARRSSCWIERSDGSSLAVKVTVTPGPVPAGPVRFYTRRTNVGRNQTERAERVSGGPNSG
ncbi:hypothetical protein KFK09_013681 [Dendrobium nobile]|uniref:Uncharacterized protein n=1 Tax=Dendrobium nobile TaxID=94219 RepID=A0A8T3B9J5_DENNO|nr:hypothetical protein KFK09_013681 [Dendrobium nobile]